MRIKLGYVSISNSIEVTPSSTLTYTIFSKNNYDIDLINKTVLSNIEALSLIIDYNIKNNIHFYRLTSKLIPLATHKSVCFDYSAYKEQLGIIGDKIKTNCMRVDTHPDQFAVLNSTNNEVLENTFRILEYHYNILDMIGIKPTIILHVGSSCFGKDKSISRFINNFNKLDANIKKSIVLENDDKVYDVLDTLTLCKRIKVPFVLDYHHYICNNCSNIKLDDYMNEIFDTWGESIPKMHYSSPKNKTKKEFRSHSDYINVFEFISFIEFLKNYDKDIDIMLEVKQKDDALFRLVRQLKLYTDYKFIDETSFIV